MMTGTVLASEEGQPAEVAIRVPKSHWAAIIGAIGVAALAFYRAETKEPEVIRREVPAEVSQKLERIDTKIDDLKDRMIRVELRLDNRRGDNRVANGNVAKEST